MTWDTGLCENPWRAAGRLLRNLFLSTHEKHCHVITFESQHVYLRQKIQLLGWHCTDITAPLPLICGSSCCRGAGAAGLTSKVCSTPEAPHPPRQNTGVENRPGLSEYTAAPSLQALEHHCRSVLFKSELGAGWAGWTAVRGLIHNQSELLLSCWRSVNPNLQISFINWFNY